MCATDLLLPMQNVLEELGHLKRQLENRVVAEPRSQFGHRCGPLTHRPLPPPRGSLGRFLRIKSEITTRILEQNATYKLPLKQNTC